MGLVLVYWGPTLDKYYCVVTIGDDDLCRRHKIPHWWRLGANKQYYSVIFSITAVMCNLDNEDPAAKDFVARKARTIALSKAQGTQQSTLFTSLEIPWGFLTQDVLPSLAGLMSRKKVSVQGFLWVRKVWFVFVQRTFAPETFGDRRKGENVTASESTTRFPQASCFEKPTCSVPETWGCMYDVPARSAKVQKTGREI